MTERRIADLGEYVDQRGEWLGRCALLLTRDHDDALDLVQDTLVLAWRSRELVLSADDPERYILRVMMNAFRGRSRRRQFRLVHLHEEEVSSTADASSQVSEADLIARALSTLTPRQRSVIVLRYWADLDDEEIADALDCRRATVRSLSSRGVAKIKRYLESS